MYFGGLFFGVIRLCVFLDIFFGFILGVFEFKKVSVIFEGVSFYYDVCVVFWDVVMIVVVVVEKISVVVKKKFFVDLVEFVFLEFVKI